MNREEFKTAKFTFRFISDNGLSEIVTNGNTERQAKTTLAKHLRDALKQYPTIIKQVRKDNVIYDVELDTGQVVVTRYNLTSKGCENEKERKTNIKCFRLSRL